MEKLRLLVGEAQDLAEIDLIKENSRVAPPALERKEEAPETPIEGGGRKHKDRREEKKGSEHQREGKEDRKRKAEKGEKSSSSRPLPEESQGSRGPSPRKERKRSRKEEDQDLVEEKPAEERRKEKAAPASIPVKKEPLSEEEESSEEEEEEEDDEVTGPKTPDGEPPKDRARVPQPPQAPLPGAKTIAWPKPRDRPPLQRWQGPIPAARRGYHSAAPVRNSGRRKERRKGKKKRERCESIRRAGGLAAWHASKAGR